jgi:hypothetical protein
MQYADFITNKSQLHGDQGFEPTFMPKAMYPFQVALVEWACRKGRAAIFADCGLGKTPMQLTWAENVARQTNDRVLILTPLAVSYQTVLEGEKFDIEVTHRRDSIRRDDRLVVTNYERLDHFDKRDFVGVVCDESSILKNFDGVRRQQITEFMRQMPYRLLCTATAAPNDFIELGTSSEALGEMGYADMLTRFFKQDGKYSRRFGCRGGQGYLLRSHAEDHFWRWICSWARAIRAPSDMGFEDGGFILPELSVKHHIVKASKPREGYLFDLPAVGLQEQRQDLKRTLNERAEMAASLINGHDRYAVAWCNLNSEGTLLAKRMTDAVEVSGSDSEDRKESVLYDFAKGNIRILVTKPSIAGFGMNWQHCNHQTFFPSHSYEQYYQAVRRSWRFGQQRPVKIDMITTDGQATVLDNLERKAHDASVMFDRLVSMMWHELKIERHNEYTTKEEIPAWL